MPKENKNGLWSGHIGSVVYRVIHGRQIVQAMPSQYKDKNSVSQQKQRSGMRNILVNHRALKSIIRDQFEDEKDGRNAYNRFLHHNLMLPPVELPKEKYDVGRGFLAPYIVSSGTLPSLDVEVKDGRLQFMMKSEDWEKDDILRLVHVKYIDKATCVPNYLFASSTEVFIEDISDRLIVSEPLLPGAYAYVHLRNKGHGKQSSTQNLILV